MKRQGAALIPLSSSNSAAVVCFYSALDSEGSKNATRDGYDALLQTENTRIYQKRGRQAAAVGLANF